MGSSFWKILGVVLLVAIVGVALSVATAMNPQIQALAVKMAADSHLPIWLVGLAAPIVFVFKKFFGAGSSDKLDAIERENEKLKTEQTKLRQEVSALNGWRDQELSRQRAEIARLQNDLDALRSRIAGVDGQIAALQGASLDEIGHGMTDEQKRAAGLDFIQHDTGLGIIE
jgi:septal ring factor EnvC (AmiA/AmiB activator)